MAASEGLGLVDCWRAYLMDQFKQTGASSSEIKAAIASARASGGERVSTGEAESI